MGEIEDLLGIHVTPEILPLDRWGGDYPKTWFYWSYKPKREGAFEVPGIWLFCWGMIRYESEDILHFGLRAAVVERDND